MVRPSEKVSEGVNRKPGSKSSFFGSPPYFYFRFRCYSYRDGRFCLIFVRTAKQSVLDGRNWLSSSKPCAYCRRAPRSKKWNFRTQFLENFRTISGHFCWFHEAQNAENARFSYVSEVCRKTFRYMYIHDSRFDIYVEDLEKSGNYIR